VCVKLRQFVCVRNVGGGVGGVVSVMCASLSLSLSICIHSIRDDYNVAKMHTMS